MSLCIEIWIFFPKLLLEYSSAVVAANPASHQVNTVLLFYSRQQQYPLDAPGVGEFILYTLPRGRSYYIRKAEFCLGDEAKRSAVFGVRVRVRGRVWVRVRVKVRVRVRV